MTFSEREIREQCRLWLAVLDWIDGAPELREEI
jgi:hypothetical protein